MKDKPRPRVWPVFASLALLIIAVRSFQAHSNVFGFLLLAAAIIIPFYFETTRKARLATVSLVLGIPYRELISKVGSDR